MNHTVQIDEGRETKCRTSPCPNIEKKVNQIGIEPMYCPRCKNRMKESKRPFHKQRKWICPKCGKVGFQVIKKQKD